MDGLGIGYRSFAEGHPRLIWAAVAVRSGRCIREVSCRQLSAQAMGGALPHWRTARAAVAGRRPWQADGVYDGAGGCERPLWRDKSGRGQFIDVSVQEAIVSQMESFTTRSSTPGVYA
jgi:crotonobetainyl-CoA:carnitine CoA-transferase CaiB-like acyl-CoA transferase